MKSRKNRDQLIFFLYSASILAVALLQSHLTQSTSSNNGKTR